MLEPNRNYVIDTDGNIHKMLFVGDCDWDEKSVSSLQEIRADAIREFSEQIRSKSSDILIWLMKRQENGYGTTNGELHNKWLDVVDEIAGQMIADRKGE